MAYTITKQPDGDLSIGNLRGEWVVLQPALSDYQTGGYLIQGIGETTENTGDVGLYKVLFVTPCGDNSNYFAKWNPSTSKLQIFQDSTSNQPFGEVNAGTNLAPYQFNLLLWGQ